MQKNGYWNNKGYLLWQAFHIEQSSDKIDRGLASKVNSPTEEKLKLEGVKVDGKKGYIRSADEKFFEEKIDGSRLSLLFELIIAASSLNIGRLVNLIAIRTSRELCGKNFDETIKKLEIEKEEINGRIILDLLNPT